mmetsp:Transcript_90242/g.254642  ORF Transcript_90242/g.254642 Transcript_90242/m.254642 type:complete len:203 (-) Transcript_90242:484-1092(-)
MKASLICAVLSRRRRSLRHIVKNSLKDMSPDWSTSYVPSNCSQLLPGMDSIAWSKRFLIRVTGSATKSKISSIETVPELSWSKLSKRLRICSSSGGGSRFRTSVIISVNSSKLMFPDPSVSTLLNTPCQSSPPKRVAAPFMRSRSTTASWKVSVLIFSSWMTAARIERARLVSSFFFFSVRRAPANVSSLSSSEAFFRLCDT